MKKVCLPSGSLEPLDDLSCACIAGTPYVCFLCGVGLYRVPQQDGRDWLWSAVADGKVTGRNDKPEFDLPAYLAMCDEGNREMADYYRTRFYGWSVPWNAPTYSHAPFFHIHHPAPCPAWCVHPPRERAAPECCHRPMWATPTGWQCRVSGRNFGYTDTLKNLENPVVELEHNVLS